MSCSIEPTPPASFLARPSNGLTDALPAAFAAMSGANLQPDESVVRLRVATAAINPLTLPPPPVSRAEMAPQGTEKPRLAPENCASMVALSGDEPAQAFAFALPKTSRRNSRVDRPIGLGSPPALVLRSDASRRALASVLRDRFAVPQDEVHDPKLGSCIFLFGPLVTH